MSTSSAPSDARALHNIEINNKLTQLGISLATPQIPTGNYVLCQPSSDGKFLHVCGHSPIQSDGTMITGKLGDNVSIDQGYVAARCCAIQILATLHHHLQGDWSRLVQILKVVGFVNCTPDFVQQPAVINGASDLFGQVFGPRGRHARSAVGMQSLPFGIATEVECVVEIKPEDSE